MAEAVAVGRIGDSGGQHGSAHRHLRQGGIQVVTDLPPGLGITPAVVLWEYPLPGLFPGGVRVLPLQGMGQLHPSPACSHVALMDLSHLPQLVLERFQQAVRQQRVPVLVAFAGTQGHQPLLAIAGFHSQPESLPEP